MTGWTMNGDTRHIPEEELHAYLDQALSRSQCAEIECHLAECLPCAALRGEVAAMRDRITSLLSHAVPLRRAAPPFEQLVARHQGQATQARSLRRRLARGSAIAASLLGALGAGWLSRGFLLPDTAPPAAAAPVEAAATDPQPAAEERTLVAVRPPETDPPRQDEAAEAIVERPARRPSADLSVVRVSSEAAPLTIQVSTFDPVDDGSGMLDGLWQTVDWYEAWTLTGGNLPRIDGLPVVAVQIQRGSGDARPVVVVSQQHPSGRVVRTIEGPVERVAALVEGRLGSRVNASAASFTPPDYIATDAGTRRGLRILTVTGALPADSLNALARDIALRD